MKTLLKLIKLSWNLKLEMWKCRMLDKKTDEYRLATHYQKALDKMENKEHEVEAMILEIQKLQNEFQDRKKITRLLTSVTLFLKHLKLLRS